MRGRPHNQETRAAVMAALLTGQSISEVASTYKLDKSVVSRWSKEVAPQLQRLATQKERDFDELISGYLEDILVTLSVQARTVRDEAWVKQQPASEIAVLHGVLADKAFRLLTARAAAEEAARDTAGEPQ